MKFYEEYITFKENIVIENKKKHYIDLVDKYFEQFNKLLQVNRFIKEEMYLKSINYYKDTYLFIKQLNNSKIIEEYFNYNIKIVKIFELFINSYEMILDEIKDHNKNYQNKDRIILKNIFFKKNILLLIKSLEKSFEKSVIINVLQGKRLDNIIEQKLDQSKGFGKLKNVSYQEIKREIEELIDLHYLKINEEIPTLLITKKGMVQLKKM